MLLRVILVPTACLFLSAGSALASGAKGDNATTAHDAWKSLDSQNVNRDPSGMLDFQAPNILDGRNIPDILSNPPNALNGDNRINALDGRNHINALDGRNHVNALDGRNRVNALE